MQLNALSFFEDKKVFGLKRKENKITPDPTQRYDERKRNNISNVISGGIYKTILTIPIPLDWDTDNYYTLKRSALAYSLLEKGINVSYIPEGATAVAGFVGKNVANAQREIIDYWFRTELAKESVSCFVDNPIFRAFWENGKLLLFNSVFLNTN